MNVFLHGNSLLIFAVLLFIAVVLLIDGMYVLWRDRRGPAATRLSLRLRALSAARDETTQARLLRQRMLSEVPGIDRVLEGLPRMHALDRLIVQSGLEWTVGKLLLGSALLGAVTWLAGTALTVIPLLQVLAAVGTACIPLAAVLARRARRLRTIERQLPDALDLITRALQAGHAFSSALKMSGEEMPEPIATELRTVHDEVNFGVSLEEALAHLSDRVPLTDLRYFVVAVLIQRDSGGNLTEILANLSGLIRQRLRLYARVRVLSSEGRLSAWILALMPFGLAALMNVFNPAFMRPLWTDPIGIAIVQYTLAMMAVGVLLLIKIVRIRV